MANKTVVIPPFETTKVDDIPGIAARLRQTFGTGKTKSIEYRLTQLRRLYWAIYDHQEELKEALMRDLGKPAYEAMMSEVHFIGDSVMHMIDHLASYARDERVTDVPVAFKLAKPRIRKEPLGAVLVIGAFNYPFVLSMGPFIGAIGAGNTAVLKPSEVSPHTAMVMRRIVETSLDPDAYAVVNGGVPETTALLDEKWAKICYTGSTAVGKIVARKAAETLTPVLLELGGENPAFVTSKADVALAARRLLWAKVMAAGQACVAHNYLLIERPVVDRFVEETRKQVATYYPEGPRHSKDFARIVNKRHFQRIKKLLDETHGRIVLGGSMDEDALFIEPTLVLVDSPQDPLVVNEIFGPIAAILPFDRLPDAVATANQVNPTPLALYAFGSPEETSQILSSVTSGGATVNDTYFHCSAITLPFGGVGTSGIGSYRGKDSFDAFTHRRTVLETPLWLEKLLRSRYPPYKPEELKRLRMLIGRQPDFDRQGRKIGRGLRYWAWFVAALGGGSAKGAFVRWIVLLGAAVAAWSSSATLRRLLGGA